MKWLLAMLVLCLSEAAVAGIYKWTDASGTVHFSDSPHAGASRVKLEGHINSYTHVSYSALDSKTAHRNSQTGQNELVMYGATWCPYCREARRYFQANDIPFKEYLIDKSAQAKRRYDQLGVQGIPVIIMGNRQMHGFSVAGFQQFYAQR